MPTQNNCSSVKVFQVQENFEQRQFHVKAPTWPFGGGPLYERGSIIWILKPLNLQNPSLYGWNINVITYNLYALSCCVWNFVVLDMQFVMSLTFELVHVTCGNLLKPGLGWNNAHGPQNWALGFPARGRPRGAGEIHLLGFLEDVIEII